MYDVIIVDPTAPEFNRGSFCYQPYLLYSFFKKAGKSVLFLEDFSVVDTDRLAEGKEIYVALWCYPQIDVCKVIDWFNSEIKFFGYTPLIQQLGFPLYKMSPSEILSGMESYYLYYEDFRYLLLSDCDMHLKKYKGTVYPLFTTYGCPNGCSFCPSTVNCSSRVISSVEEVKKALTYCKNKGFTNIHFTDEDFFFDINRAQEIMSFAKNKGFNFIALGSARKVHKFIRKYGQNILHEGGMRLIEIGLETSDKALGKTMGKSFGKHRELAKEMTVDVFWLTLTFFPGETITTLNKTGCFLEEYGWDATDLFPRIKTNSTVGGLGQFFQPYHGTKAYTTLEKEGCMVDDRPVRLVPSFLPYSFLTDTVKQLRNITEEDTEWFALYKLPRMKIYSGKTVAENCDKNSHITRIKSAVYLAICARLGIIISGGGK